MDTPIISQDKHPLSNKTLLGTIGKHAIAAHWRIAELLVSVTAFPHPHVLKIRVSCRNPGIPGDQAIRVPRSRCGTEPFKRSGIKIAGIVEKPPVKIGAIPVPDFRD